MGGVANSSVKLLFHSLSNDFHGRGFHSIGRHWLLMSRCRNGGGHKGGEEDERDWRHVGNCRNDLRW